MKTQPKKKLNDCKTVEEVRAYYNEKASVKVAAIKRREKHAEERKRPILNHAKFILAGIIIASGKAGEVLEKNKALVDKLSTRDKEALNTLFEEINKK